MWKRPVWRLAALAFFFPSHAGALTPAAETGDCSLDGATPAIVAAIDDDFSLLLDDGRRASVSGLEFPPASVADLRAAARARLSDWLSGREVFVGAFATASDRWGHLPARVFAATDHAKDAPLLPVAAALLEEGLARFRPDPPVAPCAKTYLAAEATARTAKRALWSRTETAVIDAMAPAIRESLLHRTGMTVVEGEVRSTGQSKGAIYLNLNEKKLEGFAVVISRRNLDMFAAAGISPPSLVGRRIRVRGLIETSFGPRIEVSTPAEIELIAEDVTQ